MKFRRLLSCVARTSLLLGTLSAAASQVQEKTEVQQPKWREWSPFGSTEQFPGVALGLDGHIWVADSSRKQLLRFDESGKFTAVPTGGVPPGILSRASNGDFLATTNDATILQVSPTGNLSSINLDQSATTLAPGPDGSTWVIEDAVVGRIYPDRKVREYSMVPGDDVGAGSSVAQQMGGDVWFDAETPGYSYYLASMNPKTGQIKKHFKDSCGYYPLPIVAAPDGRVWVVCKDSNGRFQVYDGFEPGGGVVRIPWPKKLAFTMVGGYNNAIVGPDNAIWIAGQNVVNDEVAGGAFVRFDLVSHTFRKYTAPQGYWWENGLAFDSSGNIWAGTDNGQVQELLLH